MESNSSFCTEKCCCLANDTQQHLCSSVHQFLIYSTVLCEITLLNQSDVVRVRIQCTEITGELTRDYLDGRSDELLQRRLLMLPWQPDDMTHLSYEQHEDDDLFKAVCMLCCSLVDHFQC